MKTLTHRKRLNIPDWLAIALIFLLGTALIVFVVYKFHLFIEGHISETFGQIKGVGSSVVASLAVVAIVLWCSDFLPFRKKLNHKTY